MRESLVVASLLLGSCAMSHRPPSTERDAELDASSTLPFHPLTFGVPTYALLVDVPAGCAVLRFAHGADPIPGFRGDDDELVLTDVSVHAAGPCADLWVGPHPDGSYTIQWSAELATAFADLELRSSDSRFFGTLDGWLHIEAASGAFTIDFYETPWSRL